MAKNNEVQGGESRGRKAKRKAADAERQRAQTLGEIKQHYGILLELRDRKIGQLEQMLAHVPPQSETELSPTERMDFKVLVVESSSVLRTAMIAALQRRFQAFAASDCKEAMHLLGEKPDLILAELSSSDERAEQISELARLVAGKVPLAVIYEPEAGHMLNYLQELGILEGIEKPFELGEIVQMVEAFARASRKPISGYTHNGS